MGGSCSNRPFPSISTSIKVLTCKHHLMHRHLPALSGRSSYPWIIGQEETQSGIDFCLPGIVGDYTVGQAADNGIAGPILGSGLRIFAEQRWVAVSAGADGALERVEGFLTCLGSGNGQPGSWCLPGSWHWRAARSCRPGTGRSPSVPGGGAQSKSVCGFRARPLGAGLAK